MFSIQKIFPWLILNEVYSKNKRFWWNFSDVFFLWNYFDIFWLNYFIIWFACFLKNLSSQNNNPLTLINSFLTFCQTQAKPNRNSSWLTSHLSPNYFYPQFLTHTNTNNSELGTAQPKFVFVMLSITLCSSLQKFLYF